MGFSNLCVNFYCHIESYKAEAGVAAGGASAARSQFCSLGKPHSSFQRDLGGRLVLPVVPLWSRVWLADVNGSKGHDGTATWSQAQLREREPRRRGASAVSKSESPRRTGLLGSVAKRTEWCGQSWWREGPGEPTDLNRRQDSGEHRVLTIESRSLCCPTV